jgi:hypothetical protein
MTCSVFEEGTNDVQSFVVGYMCSGLLVTSFRVEILDGSAIVETDQAES